MKSILMSIRPNWCELIANGTKTIEVRKTKPKLKPPFKVYIYCTKPNNFYKISEHMCTSNEYLHLCDGKVSMGDGFEFFDKEYEVLNSKVIGEFICEQIEELSRNAIFNAPALYSQSCMTREEYFNYIGDKTAYIWHISDLKIYDKPKELCFFGKCHQCPYGDHARCVEHEFSCNGEYILRRPPQSWCYAEEI